MLAEINRKEWQFRQEKKKFDDERKTHSAKEAERAAQVEVWKGDVQALIEAHGWTIDTAIDFLAKGGASSAEGRVRALESKIQKQERETREREEQAARDAETAQQTAARMTATRHVHTEVARLIAQERFEYCAAEESIASEVVRVIKGKWEGIPVLDEFGNDTGRREGGGEDISVEQALELCEAVLDKKNDRLAQSKKLRAKFGSPSPANPATPEAQRQNPTVPSATPKRTITIKQRQQAVAPIRKPADGRASREEVTRAVAANLGKLFGGN